MYILSVFYVAGKTEYVYVRVTEPARFAVEVYLWSFFFCKCWWLTVTFEELLVPNNLLSNSYNFQWLNYSLSLLRVCKESLYRYMYSKFLTLHRLFLSMTEWVRQNHLNSPWIIILIFLFFSISGEQSYPILLIMSPYSKVQSWQPLLALESCIIMGFIS